MHLYVHIPFCHHICPYCGFYKHTPQNLANRDFVDAILSEAQQRADESLAPFKTIFFGGGTPSLLSPTHLQHLCEGLKEVLPLDEVTEWTMEMNPATFDLEKARLIRELGVTRASLGVQSFQPDVLSTLGRDHTPENAIDAFRLLRETDFQCLSLDLMFSIPGQSLSSWQRDLETALSLQPDHISAYNLTYEEDTEFLDRHKAGELNSDEDRDADLFYFAIDTLEGNGYDHYEISNYARPGFESRHNQAYWHGADYLGLGPGAVSTWKGQRWTTLADTATYVKASQSGIDTRSEIELLSEEDKRIERIGLALRTKDGISRGLVGESNPLEPLIEQGLINVTEARVRLTREGKALADPIAAALV